MTQQQQQQQQRARVRSLARALAVAYSRRRRHHRCRRRCQRAADGDRQQRRCDSNSRTQPSFSACSLEWCANGRSLARTIRFCVVVAAAALARIQSPVHSHLTKTAADQQQQQQRALRFARRALVTPLALTLTFFVARPKRECGSRPRKLELLALIHHLEHRSCVCERKSSVNAHARAACLANADRRFAL